MTTYRTTGDKVKEIIDTTLTASEIGPFIRVANLFVTEKLDGSGLSDDLLAEIERWLAAHFVSIRDPMYKSEATGDASATMFGQAGKGLDATLYGQQVKMLDPTGQMASVGMLSASLEVIDFIDDSGGL